MIYTVELLGFTENAVEKKTKKPTIFILQENGHLIYSVDIL